MTEPTAAPTIFRRGSNTTTKTGPIAKLFVKGLNTSYPVRRNRFFVSDMICSRKSTLFTLMPEDARTPWGAAASLYTETGNAAHELVTKSFENLGILLAAEIRTPDNSFNLGGRIDNVIDLDGQPMIIEVKTTGALPGSPKKEHENQAVLYTMLTGVPSTLFYISRSIADYAGKIISAEFELHPSAEQLYEAALNLTTSYYSALRKKVPPKPMKFTSKSSCGRCPFLDMCWGDEEFPAEELSGAEQLQILEIAHKEAKRLIEETPERHAAFLAALEKVKKEKEVAAPAAE